MTGKDLTKVAQIEFFSAYHCIFVLRIVGDKITGMKLETQVINAHAKKLPDALHLC